MTVVQRIREPNDQFPVGMRVLAVDDDPICLMLLETLLRKCQYHVTVTSQAIQALQMLRENRDRFDLVISDVHMPDMDGFKLLELVGLEMDLPVIMLSANGDTKLVMKGITHGACDYLLKPVRMEELKNIWQHVVRKKRVEPQDRRDCNNLEKRSGAGSEGQQGSSGLGNQDQDGKCGKRRKDQYEEEDEENDENEHDNDDSSTTKKPRVVWSVELHRKFVAAVDQLGLDKAVPKKILELMNVEKLTRENVASHLQKYRLYLKRISNVANQQANMVAALGGTDPSYLRMNAVNFNHYSTSGQFPNNALRPLPPAGMLGRLNSPAGLGIHGISPPAGIIPLGHGQISRNPVTDYKLQSPLLPGEQTGNILQGLPTSLELPGTSDNSRIYPLSTGFTDALKGTNNVLGGSSNSLVGGGLPNSTSLLYQGRGGQESQIRGGPFGNQPSPVVSLPDSSSRCNGNWPGAIQTSAATFPSRSNYNSAAGGMLTTSGLTLNGVSGSDQMNGATGINSTQLMSVVTTGGDQAQLQPAGGLLSGGSTMSLGGYASSKRVWDDDSRLMNALQQTEYSSNSFSTAPSFLPSGGGVDPQVGMANRNAGFGLSGQANSYDSLAAAVSVASQHHGTSENSGLGTGGYNTAGNAGSLEDVVTAMIKREPDGTALKGW